MQSIQEAMAKILPDEIIARAQDHVGRRLDQWKTQEDALSSLMPNVTLEPLDMIFNLDVIGAVEDQGRRCTACHPQTWSYSPKSIPSNPSERSCSVPLLPVVTRDQKQIPKGCGVGRLRLSWIQCSVFRKWVEEQEKRGQRGHGASEEPSTYGDGPRKTWKRRRHP